MIKRLQTIQKRAAGTQIIKTRNSDSELEGILTGYVCVYGVACQIYWWKEIIHNGAFAKSIQENGPSGSNQIRVLWQHRTSEVIGAPIRLEEHERGQLPTELLQDFPAATGGLFADFRLTKGVRRADEALLLYNDGAMNEFSIGFSMVNADEETKDEEEIVHVREAKLWEFSPVTWGANPATMVTGIRSQDSYFLQLARRLQNETPDISNRNLIDQLSQHLLTEPERKPLRDNKAALLADVELLETQILAQT